MQPKLNSPPANIISSLLHIPLRQLPLEDSPFSLNQASNYPKLAESLEQLGLLQPLVVRGTLSAANFAVVDGVYRLRAIAALHWHTDTLIPCLQVSPQIESKDILIWKLSSIGLQTNGKAEDFLNNFQKLRDWGASEAEIVTHLLPTYGLPQSPKLLQELLVLLVTRHQEKIQFPNNFSLSDLLLLKNLQASEILAALSLYQAMSIGSKKWQSLVQLLSEVVKRQKTNLADFLAQEELAHILHNSELQGPVKYRTLKEKAEKLRYPELDQWTKKIEQALKKLHLSQGIQVEFDPILEKESLKIAFEIFSVADLEEKCRELTAQHREMHWQKLFHLLQGSESLESSEIPQTIPSLPR